MRLDQPDIIRRAHHGGKRRDSIRQVVLPWYVLWLWTAGFDAEEFSHESDVRDRQAERFDPRQPLLVSERWYLNTKSESWRDRGKAFPSMR